MGGERSSGHGCWCGLRYKLMSGERSSGQGCWCGLKVQVDEWGEIIRARVLVWDEGTS